jgi:hypothetical protein
MCFARSGVGIQCLSSDDIAIEGNVVVATGPAGNGIFLRSQSSSIDNISIRDNDITVKDRGSWNFGIRLAATDPHRIGHVSVIGNSISQAEKGIVFEGPGFRQMPVCSLNRIGENVTSPFVGIQNLPNESMVVGGATSRGGTTATSGAGCFIAGCGDPNNKVIGNVGDMFQRIDGTPGATFYVKESGNNTVSGWIAK